ncbi:hypothetical protein EVAR_51912_1 [Eumeta japonica]|uniref:Uncharacterized protein n=1 Tax=Eumeta variegata TaxID=151549 RepID=A0A4C1XFM0_EUMVA|nr:hypothetical protein EVAR_51912_1 [Eumeta japonica]
MAYRFKASKRSHRHIDGGQRYGERVARVSRAMRHPENYPHLKYVLRLRTMRVISTEKVFQAYIQTSDAYKHIEASHAQRDRRQRRPF